MTAAAPPALRLSLRQDVSDPAFVQDPYPTYAAIHARGGAVFWEQYGFWCFAGFESVNALLRDRRFGRVPPIPDVVPDRAHLAWFDRVERFSLLGLEPPDHTRLRKAVNRAFVSAAIERMRPAITAHAERLARTLAGPAPVDVLEAYATPLALRVIATLMGVPDALERPMLGWSHAMCRLYTLRATRADEEAADAACRAFHAALADLIAHKRRAPADDLLSTLADGALAEEEIISTAVLLMNAGHEATVHQIGNALLTLLTAAPEAIGLCAREAGAAAVVEEALRYRAPLHLFTRHAGETVTLADGITIPAGDRIGLLLGAANRDPAAFAAPERFWPGRPDQKHVSFGAGIHFCVGAPLARLELMIGLGTLLRHHPRLALAEAPRFADSYHFHGLSRLMVVSGD
jgi:unspecific monooxygenase